MCGLNPYEEANLFTVAGSRPVRQLYYCTVWAILHSLLLLLRNTAYDFGNKQLCFPLLAQIQMNSVRKDLL